MSLDEVLRFTLAMNHGAASFNHGSTSDADQFGLKLSVSLGTGSRSAAGELNRPTLIRLLPISTAINSDVFTDWFIPGGADRARRVPVRWRVGDHRGLCR